VAVVFWLSLSFGNPLHLRLWGAMYPARQRGRVVGVLGMGRAAAGALAAFAGGVIADRIGGEQAVAVAGLIGVVCAVGYCGFRAAAAERPAAFSARESVRALRARPLLSKIALAQGFYGGGLIAATPLYALVHVDRLNLSLADVGVIGILTAIATTVAFPIWGMVSDLDVAAAACGDIDACTAALSAVTPLQTVASDEPLTVAAQAMAFNGLAHLAVLDPATRRPVGVLSTLDVARAVAAGPDS